MLTLLDRLWEQMTGPPPNDEAEKRPLAKIDTADGPPRNGDIVINGVSLSPSVAQQLRQLGISLSWYTPGQLQSAVQACSVDGTLIDDPDGVNFGDKLSLDAREKSANDGDIEADAHRRYGVLRNVKNGDIFSEPEAMRGTVYEFRERIKSERKRRSQQSPEESQGISHLSA